MVKQAEKKSNYCSGLENNRRKSIKRFHDLCQENLKDADGNYFCPFCGEIKKEFLSPLTDKIVLLDCECERKIKHLRETYKSYRECKHNGIFYSDLIDGKRRPVNSDENQILIFGTKLKDSLSWAEKKLENQN